MTENTNAVQLEKLSPGHYLLKGQLNFKSVPMLWSNNRTTLFSDEMDTLDVDLSQLERSDSSGLALLVEWYREAELQNKKITFFNLPSQMYDIARLSDLNEVLPLALRPS
ncbi:MAG: STAS domain-containing protein [gamma proteobacterium symbiont of Bathyaustriella thionipta]|nr:STAS domain-containing protein [gamma proteobacterium symbiont of Bathyaustriella thionipta]MCU7948424.1 STAS domain-containing protein [gamma proteobacterium symbiont of Bathyaustriella thionipta]MCU7954123.1 STAS domain-containing protein [gamma proteobacterium symbiont of Bathyaustriella thionipta]MCU7955416.1 STAS domain-containing protein [gamma proteobacterium symbiont of Bathyaustriella thionipta]MCU7968816.1 STAS domain-containing protein [gamma proteobacterium symbiont of Bathyaustr